jgi:protein-disulfide isomerase
MSLKPPVSDKDHIQGISTAVIELVEYGDYECPHCGHAYPIVKSIQHKLGNQLKFIFRNFPLQEIHEHAVAAAVAAEAAAKQGKFWEFHDLLFENQDRLSGNTIVLIAEKLKLDLTKFRGSLHDETIQQKVDDDFESGVRSGVNGTPTFFINGKKYAGSWDEDSLLAFLKKLL